jgi:D-psicose/D-tagatose/L-ribulose 3-epimerase
VRFAYNTNGVQNHRLEDAVDLIRDAGYDGVALTLDIHHLDPFAPDVRGRARTLRRHLGDLGVVVETGARYLLDPRVKHEPTLVSPERRERRIDFLVRAAEVAHELEAECVSFWAGVPRVDPEQARRWLLEGLHELLDRVAPLGVVMALEPEPGMLVETADDWRALGVPGLRLALDTGHCLVTGEREPADAVREFAPDRAAITVEDMRRGEHVHLPFGEGDMDVPSVLAAIEEIGWTGLVCVELSRDSHRAHEMVPAALAALR